MLADFGVSAHVLMIKNPHQTSVSIPEHKASNYDGSRGLFSGVLTYTAAIEECPDSHAEKWHDVHCGENIFEDQDCSAVGR